MLYFIRNADGRLEISTEYTRDAITRNDFDTLADAEAIAAEATETSGELYIATDGGRGRYPRFDVIRAPRVGDAVSGSFNGDTYPEGEIIKISPTLKRIETSSGATFYRRKNTGTWLNGGTFALVAGHHNERNPSF